MGVGGTPPFHKEKICYNSNLDWFVCVKKLIWLVLFGVTSQDSHLKLVCLHVCVKLLLEMIRQEQILHQDEPLAVSLQVPCLHRAEGGEEWSWGRWKTPKLFVTEMPNRLGRGPRGSHNFQEVKNCSLESDQRHLGHPWCCLHQEWQDRQVDLFLNNKSSSVTTGIFRLLMIAKNAAKPETQEGSFEPSVATRVVTSDANYYHLAAWKVPEDLKDLAHKD